MDEQILENIPTEPEITVEENSNVEPVVDPEPIPPELYTVYIQIDDASRIIAINSSAFLPSTEGWVEIDSGLGDRYHHAQGNYLESPLIDERGLFLYKLENGKAVKRSAAEVEADYKPQPAAPTQEERLAALEDAFNLLLEGVTE